MRNFLSSFSSTVLAVLVALQIPALYRQYEQMILTSVWYIGLVVFIIYPFVKYVLSKNGVGKRKDGS